MASWYLPDELSASTSETGAKHPITQYLLPADVITFGWIHTSNIVSGFASSVAEHKIKPMVW
jgi:hypothetical protein